jgi:hypothetical protein
MQRSEAPCAQAVKPDLIRNPENNHNRHSPQWAPEHSEGVQRSGTPRYQVDRPDLGGGGILFAGIDQIVCDLCGQTAHLILIAEAEKIAADLYSRLFPQLNIALM